MLGYALMDTVMFFATFGIGRSASRWKGRWKRKGVR
jgi:hypothetical protein